MLDMTIPEFIQFLKATWQTATISDLITLFLVLNGAVVAVLPPDIAPKYDFVAKITTFLQKINFSAFKKKI